VYRSLSCHSAPTTVMLRNIPNDLKRDMLVEVLEKEGLGGLYDLLYLPVDFYTQACLGYALVNCTSHKNATRVMEKLPGFCVWPVESQEVCAVSWSDPLQGLRQLVEHYRNSPVMHEAVADQYRPILLKDGVRQPFPPPTKRVRAPRMKSSEVASGSAPAALQESNEDKD